MTREEAENSVFPILKASNLVMYFIHTYIHKHCVAVLRDKFNFLFEEDR